MLRDGPGTTPGGAWPSVTTCSPTCNELGVSSEPWSGLVFFFVQSCCTGGCHKGASPLSPWATEPRVLLWLLGFFPVASGRWRPLWDQMPVSQLWQRIREELAFAMLLEAYAPKLGRSSCTCSCSRGSGSCGNGLASQTSATRKAALLTVPRALHY